jgi:hypothetical protein
LTAFFDHSLPHTSSGACEEVLFYLKLQRTMAKIELKYMQLGKSQFGFFLNLL